MNACSHSFSKPFWMALDLWDEKTDNMRGYSISGFIPAFTFAIREREGLKTMGLSLRKTALFFCVFF